MTNKPNILVFGGNSFLAKAFNKSENERFDITNVYRNNSSKELNLDFEDPDIENLTPAITGTYNAVLFFQGINPSVGAIEMTSEHFIKMLKINLITPALLVKSLAGRLADGALVLFISSIAKKKGSYDPAYASAKAGIIGLMHSLAGAYPQLRFNTISPGLIKDSPVFVNMTPDYRQKHFERMGNKFIEVADIISAITGLIDNVDINCADIEIDG